MCCNVLQFVCSSEFIYMRTHNQKSPQMLVCVAVCCSVLQCVCSSEFYSHAHTHSDVSSDSSLCGSVLQCVAVCVAVCCSVFARRNLLTRSHTQISLQTVICVAVCCSMLQCVCSSEFYSHAHTHSDVSSDSSLWLSVLQCGAVCCSVFSRQNLLTRAHTLRCLFRF